MQERSWAFVLDETAADDRPAICRYWWPIGLRWRDMAFFGCEKGEELRSEGYGGTYVLRDRQGPRIRLVDGGQTKAQFFDEVPLTPPKSRSEIRWCHGRYQKLLKRVGWVDVGIGTPTFNAAVGSEGAGHCCSIQ